MHLRRISADPADPRGHVPAQRHASACTRTRATRCTSIQSGEFIVDGEGSYRPGELRWVQAGVTYGPERAGADGAVLLIVSTNGPVRRAVGARGRLMVLVASDLAAERPDEVALRDDARGARLGARSTTSSTASSTALGELDLGPDRRVAVLAENSVETVLAHLGGLLAGASTVPVNFHLNADEVAYILEDSGARVLFVGPRDGGDRARGRPPGRRAGRHRLASSATNVRSARGRTGWPRRRRPSRRPTSQPRPNLMYTSGTTGRPKGVELPPTMFAGGGTMTEHVAALAQSAARRLRHAPRGRADVPHRPAVGRAAARRRRPGRRARPLRRRERAAGDRRPTASRRR